MKQIIVALDDIWWSCLICGRTKPVEAEKSTEICVPVTQKHELPWATAVLSAKRERRAAGNKEKRRTQMENTSSTATKNLSDLNTALFAQLDRLSVEGLEGEKLHNEIARSKALSGIAQQIVSNATLALEAQRSFGGGNGKKAPLMLGVSE